MVPRRTPKKNTENPILSALPSDLENDNGTDQDDSADLLNQPDPNDWMDLFGEEDANVRVELYRLHPQSWHGVEISGFIELLDPSMDLSYISEKYGGGRYQVKKRRAGRIAALRTVRIAGPPKVLPPPEAADNGKRPTLSESEKIGEISIGGTDEEFFKRYERFLMIKKAFPDPPPPVDINAALLQLALQNRTGPGDPAGMLNMVDSLLEIVGRLRSESGGGTSEGSNVYDLIGKGIDAFRDYVDAAKKIPRPVRPGAIAGQAQIIPQVTAAEPSPEIEHKSEKPQEENPEMSQQQIAAQAIEIITEGYLLEPQLSIQDTADILRATLPIPEGKRDAIEPYRGVLKNMSRLRLNQYEDVEPEKIQKFILFFDAVFDNYIGKQTT